jgi:GMP synthase-like glutamine amidotransferase
MKMKKILIVQSRLQTEQLEREKNNYCRAVGDMAQCTFLSALDERLAWTYPDEFLKDQDGVIFGGTSDFDFHGGRTERDPARIMASIILSRSKLIVTYAFAQNIPILGVCFGHQLIAEMRGGNVTNDESQKKSGTFEVRLTEEGKKDRLLKDLSHSFMAQYGHKDSVTSLPEGAVLLAGSQNCRFSALRYGDKVYTVQFHPELRKQDALVALHANPEYMSPGADPEAFVDESPETQRIIPRWIERVVEQGV